MDRSGSLLLAILLASGFAVADDASNPPPILPRAVVSDAQPTERQLEHLPPSERKDLTVDFSSEKAAEVQHLYEQLTHSRKGAPLR